MKSSLSFLVLTLCASVCLAEPPVAPSSKTQEAAAALVDKQLVAPLKKADSRRSRFSRAAPAPVQRRVRVLDSSVVTDVRGKDFVRFAIDVRRGWNEKGHWQQDSIVGCAYLGAAEVFVQHGEVYVHARSLLGKDRQEQPNVCRAAPAGVVQVVSVAR